MRHVRFDVAGLAVEQVPVPLKAGSLVVADVDDGGHPQWECLAYAFDPMAIPPGRYRVDITTLDGRHLQGEAILVRSIDGAHVLRGEGRLHGVVDADLA